MLLALNLDLRNDPRKILTGLLPGPLRIKSTGEIVSSKPTDISAKGLGLLIDKEIALSEVLVLRYHSKDISLKVIWIKPDLAREHRFRYGLQLLNPKEDLEKIFTEGGCLKVL